MKTDSDFVNIQSSLQPWTVFTESSAKQLLAEKLSYCMGIIPTILAQLYFPFFVLSTLLLLGQVVSLWGNSKAHCLQCHEAF